MSRNFVQRPLPPGGPGTGAPPPGTQLTPGALGLGLQVSTTVTTVFTLLSYFMPLVSPNLAPQTLAQKVLGARTRANMQVGGALSDMRWGKFRTVAFGTAVGAVAHALVVYGECSLRSVIGVNEVSPSLMNSRIAFAPRRRFCAPAICPWRNPPGHLGRSAALSRGVLASCV